MLKRVLSESGESSEVREEDKQSHYSDSIMECRRTPRQLTGTHTSWLTSCITNYATNSFLTYRSLKSTIPCEEMFLKIKKI